MQNGTGVPQRGPDSLSGSFRQGHFAIYPGIHVISTTLLIFVTVTVLVTRCDVSLARQSRVPATALSIKSRTV